MDIKKKSLHTPAQNPGFHLLINEIQVLTLARPFQSLNLNLVEPLFCWFRGVLWVIVELKDTFPIYMQLSNKMPKVLCQYWQLYGSVHICPFTLTWPPYSWRKTVQSMVLFWPCFTVCMMLFDDVQHCFCTKDTFWSYVQKAQPWFHQNITHFPTCVWEISN